MARPCTFAVACALASLILLETRLANASHSELDLGPVALQGDDECLLPTSSADGDDTQNAGSCAVSALQLRATGARSSGSESDEATSPASSPLNATELLEAGADEGRGRSCKYFKLTGKVQMVHYRNWVNSLARVYRVKGWVANGGDKSYDGGHAPCPTCGAVLGHVEGSSSAVDSFLAKVCRGGPPHSYVSHCSTYGSACFSCPSFYKEYKFCRTWDPARCKSRC